MNNNRNNINWSCLSLNPNAIDLLKKIEIKLIGLDYHLNPNAIDLLEEKIYYEHYSNEYLVNWIYLSSNPNAINLIK